MASQGSTWLVTHCVLELRRVISLAVGGTIRRRIILHGQICQPVIGAARGNAAVCMQLILPLNGTRASYELHSVEN